jgi:16S rRNA (guanine527-N7)-methyltransferase
MAAAVALDSSRFSTLLTEGCAELGLPISTTQVGLLTAYTELLLQWNAVHNLTSLRDANQALPAHILDSMAVVRPLVRHADGRDLRVVDVGTGSGLPAVVLAVMLPTWRITAVDAVAKKIAFVRQVAGRLAVPNLLAVHSRVESLEPNPPFDVAVSRAFGSLQVFVNVTRALLREGGAWAAMKGKPPDDEIAVLDRDLQTFHVEPLHVPGLNAQRCLVWIRAASGGVRTSAPRA